jgi:hypothetical protein
VCRIEGRSSGITYQTIVCESAAARLKDGIISERRIPEGDLISDTLTNVLSDHNAIVGNESKVYLGTCETAYAARTLNLDYVTTYEAISELLSDAGLEWRIRYDDANNRYLLDVASFFGGVAAEPIVIGSNLGTIRYSTDPSQVATRIIPLGGIGYNGQRLTIRTAHGRDCIYIDRDDLVAEYGVIVRKVIHDDIACKDKSEYGTKVDELYNAGVADAQALTGKSVTWEVTAIDIARAGYNVDTFRVGWYYRIMHPILGADITLRLVEMTIDYRNPQRSKLTFGDKASTLTTSLSGTTQTTQARTTAQIINVTQIIDSRMSGLDIWKGTESKYAALQTYDANTLYACYADPTP